MVALESSLIAHGLPKKTNVATALAMEEQVRKAGAVPATVGVIEGKLRVGLTPDEIERLGKGGAEKLAVRDLPYAMARNLDGGTTVSATMRIAAAPGIPVMATGGIGGVHRGFDRTCDISTDLWELARTSMVLVCSGPKCVLDVRATMEYLETHGVPVYGYETNELPIFTSRASGIEVPKLDGASDLVEVARMSGGLGMRAATLVAVPIPKSGDLNVSSEIERAEEEARDKGIDGKDLTPYLLNRIGELTKGKFTDSNVVLLKNNAKVAGEIAVALSEDSGRRMGFVV